MGRGPEPHDPRGPGGRRVGPPSKGCPCRNAAPRAAGILERAWSAAGSAGQAVLYCRTADDPDPSEEPIRRVEGNICRRTGYHNIVLSVQTAANRWAGNPRTSTQSRSGAGKVDADEPFPILGTSASVAEAIALLQEYGEGAQAVAASSLLLIMKRVSAGTETLVDIGRIPNCAACGVPEARSRSASRLPTIRSRLTPQTRSVVPPRGHCGPLVTGKFATGEQSVERWPTRCGCDYPAAPLPSPPYRSSPEDRGWWRIPAREFFLTYDRLAAGRSPSRSAPRRRRRARLELPETREPGLGIRHRRGRRESGCVDGVAPCRHSRGCQGNGGGRLARRGDGAGAARSTPGKRRGRGGGRSGRWRDRRSR